MQLPKMDHGFIFHDSLDHAAKHEFKGPFGEQILQKTLKWLQKSLTKNVKTEESQEEG